MCYKRTLKVLVENNKNNFNIYNMINMMYHVKIEKRSLILGQILLFLLVKLTSTHYMPLYLCPNHNSAMSFVCQAEFSQNFLATFRILHLRNSVGKQNFDLDAEIWWSIILLLYRNVTKFPIYHLHQTQEVSLTEHVNKREPYDPLTSFRTDTITLGLEQAISSGNWSLKRFKMERSSVT